MHFGDSTGSRLVTFCVFTWIIILTLIWSKYFHTIELQSCWSWCFSDWFFFKGWLQSEEQGNVYLLVEWMFICCICEWVNGSSCPLAKRPQPEDSARAAEQLLGVGQSVRGSHVRSDSRFPPSWPCSRNSPNDGFLSSENNHLFTQNHKMSFLFRREQHDLESQAADQHHSPTTSLQKGAVSRIFHLITSGPALSSGLRLIPGGLFHFPLLWFSKK